MPTTAPKVMVTGGSGIVGHYIIDELLSRDFQVVNCDVTRPGNLEHSGNVGMMADALAAAELRDGWRVRPTFLQVNVEDYGALVSAMEGCTAVIGLASIPTPFNYVEEHIIRTNVQAAWNVCRAAEQLGIERVVLGSSYNAVGGQATAQARWEPRQIKPPAYFPLDADSETRAEDPYSVSKWLGEQIADAFARRSPRTSIASLRFTGVWDDRQFRRLRQSPIKDAWQRCQGFWAYVNIRDVADACVCAVEAEAWQGNKKMFINAADTMLDIPTEEALATVYPNVERRRAFKGAEAVFDISLARETIGWQPSRSWRDERYA